MYFFKAEILNLAVCWCTSGLKWMQELNHVFTFTYVYIYVWRLGLDWMSCTQPFLCFQVFFFFFFYILEYVSIYFICLGESCILVCIFWVNFL